MKHTQSGKHGVSRIAGVVLAGLMAVTANGATGAEKAAHADFYVAVSGKDTNRGTAKAPFATLARAREAMCEEVAVAGRYPLKGTIAL